MIKPIFCVVFLFLLGCNTLFSQHLFDDFLLSEEKNPDINVSEANYDVSESLAMSDRLLNEQGNDGKKMSDKTVKLIRHMDNHFKLKRVVNASSNNVEGSILLMEKLYKFVKRGGFKKIEMASSSGIDYFVGKQVGNVVGQLITVMYLEEGKVMIISSEGHITIDIDEMQSILR